MKNLNTSQIIRVKKTAPDLIDLRKKSLGCQLMTKREIASSEKTSILLDIHIKQMWRSRNLNWYKLCKRRLIPNSQVHRT